MGNKYAELFEKRGQYESLDNYEIRINSLTNKFEKLKSHQQALIFGAKADGLHWRGDDYDVFVRMVDENLKMKKWTVNEKRDYYLRLVDSMPNREIK
tara:strand:- start:1043 stop:1333 length:291 start_codon:yes stop_codon:yes gene_type:complete